MRSLTERLKAHPRRIFLIDAIGAMLTSLLLFSVILPLNDYFLFPEHFLYVLASIGGLFAAFSFTVYYTAPKRWRLFLGIVCCANVLYCVFTAALMIAFRKEISLLAVLYFSAEIFIVLLLCFVEIKLIRSTAKNEPL